MRLMIHSISYATHTEWKKRINQKKIVAFHLSYFAMYFEISSPQNGYIVEFFLHSVFKM